MSIKQISVFLENRAGSMAEATALLADAKINLRALSIADTAEFGILRIVTDRTEEALKVLEDGGFAAAVNHVLAVEIEDKPGSLAKILKVLFDAGVGVEYTYAFTSIKANTAYMIFRVDDRSKAENVLKEANINVAGQEIFR
ncbi:MAG: ACT domain-containing protein [Bacillota bacterium]|nr:ACT domain-containing protein [Bacillota bacterium]